MTQVNSYTLSYTAKPVAPWYKQLWNIRSTFIVILAPIVFLPLPILFPSAAGKCAYAIMIMATYWMTEVIPMAITALLPVVIFPWLGIMETKTVCENYLKDANMLFFGGLMVAVAVEKWNLHKRIAMKVLMIVGTRPPWLMFGFMSVTAFLSMWISNTATAAMMVPIAQAVLTELSNHRKEIKQGCKVINNNEEKEMQNKQDLIIAVVNSPQQQQQQQHSKQNHTDGLGNGHDAQQTNFDRKSITTTDVKKIDDDLSEDYYETVGKGMRLSIAYAANIGGTATLTGTGPNLVLKGQLDAIFGTETGINFSSWFVFAFPNMIISLALAWIWLMLLFIGPREILKTFRRRSKEEVENDTATSVINEEYKKLGKMSFAELMVLIHFIVLALLWLTRDPEVVPGWQSLLGHKYVSDSCVAITISILLFVVPSKFPNYLCFRRRTESDDPSPAPALLDWKTVHSQIPWNVMLLLGGGFALADGCKVSELSNVIGDFFISFQALPPWILVFVLSTLTAAFTEVTSNVATATIFLPILASLAQTIKINPLYLMLPVTVSSSFAFMLPVATPPNAIVFAYGNMKILDMVKAGVVMNFVCLFVLQLAINTWAYVYFGLGSMPAWSTSPQNLTLETITNSSLFAVA